MCYYRRLLSAICIRIIVPLSSAVRRIRWHCVLIIFTSQELITCSRKMDRIRYFTMMSLLYRFIKRWFLPGQVGRSNMRDMKRRKCGQWTKIMWNSTTLVRSFVSVFPHSGDPRAGGTLYSVIAMGAIVDNGRRRMMMMMVIDEAMCSSMSAVFHWHSLPGASARKKRAFQ